MFGCHEKMWEKFLKERNRWEDSLEDFLPRHE